GGIMGMLPGVRGIKKQLNESGFSGEAGDRMFARQGAIITSMTPAERKKPDLLNASRKRRVAAGSGTDVAEVNRLLKQHRQMADMFKAMSRDGGKGMMKMAAALGGLGGGGAPGAGMPGLPKGFTPPGGGMGGGAADLARLKALGGGKLPAPGPGGEPTLPPGLDLGKLGSLAGLGGGSPFKKK
ncbi:MAG: signal recognition particle protein, partial [Caulobacteraceae bacterium]|nr:signal recognition particle protein [Caulobacter sp.]